MFGMKIPSDEPLSVFWFRRDLRVEDNRGFYEALRAGLPVLPVFIFDTQILEKLPRADARVEFILSALEEMQKVFVQNGSSLQVYHGTPEQVWSKLLTQYKIKNIYLNGDFEPYARARDERIQILAKKNSVEFISVKDQVIHGPSEVLKDNGEPYRVFTPYSKRWLATLKKDSFKSTPSEKFLKNLVQHKSSLPTLKELGFEKTKIAIPKAEVESTLLKGYAKTRDIPSLEGTSRLGIHLRFGTISIRKLAERAKSSSNVFLNELIWREFFMQILWHYPHSATASFDPRYDKIEWINDKKQFEAWCEGRTGYPIVDAGMRELNTTGFMHNRVRMITASFLSKHLLIDWRWGERYFAEKLLDFELSANVGNWQWAAGSGVDAAPYFRVFNPELQMKKFDPQLKYVKRWVPEFGTSRYPEPIVDHASARMRAVATYQKTLKGTVK